MKHLFFTLFLVASTLVSAQSLTEDFKNAIKTDNAETFSKLVTLDNLNTCYEYGNNSYTLLALTIKYEAKACFKTLLAQKADLEKACSNKTPLMYAVKYGQLDVVKTLVEADVDYKAEDNRGRTAKDYAKKYEQKEIYEYLKALKK